LSLTVLEKKVISISNCKKNIQIYNEKYAQKEVTTEKLFVNVNRRLKAKYKRSYENSLASYKLHGSRKVWEDKTQTSYNGRIYKILSCEDILGKMTEKKIILANFEHIQFTDSLVIHSCDTVIIPSNTFSGTVIQQMIKIINVNDLRIFPRAFQGIAKAPEQMHLEATNIYNIPRDAFTNLINLKHIWFRNATIHVLASGAFRGVTNVSYIYFRDSAIHHIETNAFGSMREIQHFFLRGNISIQSCESDIFWNSTITEVILENVHLSAPLDCFDGLIANSVHLLDSTWKSSASSRKSLCYHQQIGRFTITNSSLDKLAVQAFYGTKVLRLLHSNVKSITTMRYTNNNFSVKFHAKENGKNWHKKVKWKQKEKRCMAESESLQLSITKSNSENLRQSMEISRCTIASIEKNAFRSCHHVSSLRIYRSHISNIAANAFTGLSAKSLIWQECDIGVMQSMSFRGAHIHTLLFSRSHVLTISKATFAKLTAREIILDKMIIYECQQELFAKAKVHNLSIIFTEIATGAFDQIFRNFNPTYLYMQENLFDCNMTQCGVNSLLLRHEQISWNLPWKFEGNQCTKSDLCHQTSQWIFPNINCKSYYFVVECFCVSSRFARVPNINASIITIGDCGILEIDLSNNVHIISLHIFRTEALKITKIPISMQIFETFHTKIIRIEPHAFQNIKMEKIELISTEIEMLASESFVNFYLSMFILKRTTVRYVDFNAFINTTIKMLYAEQSNFL
ncbi:unnamed protein product, partial [Thelazia callipaeda]|uniref:Beta_helix domain-containing protein n=1 Tax=Thelazia callipaeda TaxID=103827 RepID=A0A0N5D9Q5_THECL